MKHTQHLIDVMARLRNPEGGCPWDIEQNFQSIAPHTLEEAYEVVDAIQREDMDQLREELGDLLLQVVYYAQMAREQKMWDFEDVAETIVDKLIVRHPHIFGDAEIHTAEQQLDSWENIKEKERAQKAESGRVPSALDGIALALPALLRAEKLQKRAKKEGFDWDQIEPVWAKLHEEIDELKVEVDSGESKERMEMELGDLLFTAVNLARHLKIDPEQALRKSNQKFESRFKKMEKAYQDQGKSMRDSSLDELEAAWDQACGRLSN